MFIIDKYNSYSFIRIINTLFFYIIFLSIHLIGNVNIQVKEIVNSAKPFYGEIDLVLEESFTVEKGGDQNDYFKTIDDVQVSHDGNIFILEIRARRIRKFDSKGAYVGDIGKQGQGPGEYQLPLNIAIQSSTGDVFICDYGTRKIIRSDKTGKYIKSYPMDKPLSNIFIGKDDIIWAAAPYNDDRGQGNGIYQYLPGEDAGKPIFELPAEIYKENTSGVAISIPKHGYEPDLVFSPLNERIILWAVSTEYRIHVFETDGMAIFDFIKDEPPEKLSEKEKNIISNKYAEGTRKLLHFPKYKPYILKLFADNDGRIYILRNTDPIPDGKGYILDIFGSEGRFLYTAHTAQKPLIIQNGYLYCVDDTSACLRVYKIMNIKSIKNS